MLGCGSVITYQQEKFTENRDKYGNQKFSQFLTYMALLMPICRN
jgi:hypothetical protein